MTAGDAEPSALLREVRTVAGTFLAYGALFFDRLAPLYLVTLIAADLGAPSTQEGLLALGVGLGWAAAMGLVRLTTGRFGDRGRLLVATLLGAAVSLASGFAAGWVMFVALRAIGGVIAATGAPAATALVFATAPARRRGLDLGIVLSSTRLVGSLLSPVVVTAVAVAAGWRIAIAVSAAFLAVGGLILWALAPPSPVRTPTRTSTTTHLRPGGERTLFLSAVGCVALLAWLIIWSQTAVPLLVSWRDLSADAAGRLVGAFGVGAGLASLAVPALSDRIGRRAALSLAAGIGGASGVFLASIAAAGIAPSRGTLVLLVFLGGVAMGGLPLTISILPAEAVASGDVGRALTGPIAAGEVLGAALLPAGAAILAVNLGRPFVLLLSALLVLLVAGLAWAVPRTADRG